MKAAWTPDAFSFLVLTLHRVPTYSLPLDSLYETPLNFYAPISDTHPTFSPPPYVVLNGLFF